MSSLRRYPIVAALLAAVLLFLPSTRLPFTTDDFTHLVLIEDELGIHPGPPGLQARHDPFGLFNLFGFFEGNVREAAPLIRQGFMPWWTDPALRLNFWRPLSSQLELMDYQLFGRRPLGYELHSLAWYLALIALVGVLYRRCLGPAAGLAVLLFAIDGAHWMPVAWIANRNALVAAVGAFAGLLAHLRWRERGWKAGLPLSMAGFALGLGGGETALGVLAYLACYELLAAPGSVPVRARALLPAGLIALTWAVSYKVCHFGAQGSGFYVDPIGQTSEYLTSAGPRFLVLTAALFGGPPSQMALISSLATTMLPLAMAWGGAALLICGVLMRIVGATLEPETRRALRWLVPGALLSLAPVLATLPMDRLLLIPSVGAVALVAVVARWCWQGVRERRWQQAAFGALIVLFHMVMPVLTWGGMPMLFGSQGETIPALYQATFQGKSQPAELETLVLAASDMTVNMYLPIWTVYEHRPHPAVWQVLSPAPHPHRVTRQDERTLQLEVLEGGMDDGLVGKLYRGPANPLQIGDEVLAGPVRVRVLEVGPRGVTRMNVTADRPFEQLRLITWAGGRLEPVVLPAVGQSLLLPWSPGPMGM